MTMLASFALLAMLGLALLVWVMQRAVVFPKPSPPTQPPELGDASERPILRDTRGQQHEAWLLRATAGSGRRPVLVFTHGNAELIDDWHAAFDVPRSWGVHVLLVEYPGYGRSEGSPSEKSITGAMTRAYDWLIAQPDVETESIVLYGRSLGGGAATALARQRNVAALVLESSFTSVTQVAASMGVPGFLVRDPFNSLSVVRAFEGPILILHGRHDRIIPFAHGRRLADAARDATFVELDCGHNDCERPWRALTDFLSEHGLLSRP